MEIPETVELVGNTWTVSYKTLKELGGSYGQTDEATNALWIREGLRPDKEAQTFLHELLHAIHYSMGHADDHDEKEVEAMAQLLYQALFKEDI